MSEESDYQQKRIYNLCNIFSTVAFECDSKGEQIAGPLLSLLSVMEEDVIAGALDDGDVTRFFGGHGQGAAMAALAETLPVTRFWEVFGRVSFGYAEYGGADWVITKLETLSPSQLDVFFKGTMIWNLSSGGRADWVIKKLDERPLEKIIDILQSEENTSSLAEAGQLEWLITKLDHLPLNELAAVFKENYVAIDAFVKKGFVNWVVEKFDKLPAEEFHKIASEAIESICDAGHAGWLLNKFHSHPDPQRKAQLMSRIEGHTRPSPQP
jgi:hypothetical protein